MSGIFLSADLSNFIETWINKDFARIIIEKVTNKNNDWPILAIRHKTLIRGAIPSFRKQGNDESIYFLNSNPRQPYRGSISRSRDQRLTGRSNDPCINENRISSYVPSLRLEGFMGVEPREILTRSPLLEGGGIDQWRIFPSNVHDKRLRAFSLTPPGLLKNKTGENWNS